MSAQPDTPCRVCGNRSMIEVYRFGKMPLTAEFRDYSDETIDRLHDLDLDHCPACSLFQVRHAPSPETIFGGDYPYYSSVSQTLLKVSSRLAEQMIRACRLSENSLVVELASNDGYLLRVFDARDIPTLGIDPAAGPAEAARKQGIETIEAWFNGQLAQSLIQDGRQADLVIANNVLAHVPDPNDFVSGIATLLKPDGLASVEFGDAVTLFSAGAFDTVYHEHHSYFTLHAAVALFERHGLRVDAAFKTPAQGGSLRLEVRHTSAAPSGQSETVSTILEQERAEGVTDGSFAADLSNRIRNRLNAVRDFIRDAAASGRSLGAYGAAAKGVVLVNLLGKDAKHIAFVADKNPVKQGKRLPGTKIAVVAPETIAHNPPDFLLVLPWNLRDELIGQLSGYVEAGGRLVFPLPELKIYP